MAIVPIPNRPQVGRTSPLAPVSAQALAAPGLAALNMVKTGADVTAKHLQERQAAQENIFIDSYQNDKRVLAQQLSDIENNMDYRADEVIERQSGLIEEFQNRYRNASPSNNDFFNEKFNNDFSADVKILSMSSQGAYDRRLDIENKTALENRHENAILEGRDDEANDIANQLVEKNYWTKEHRDLEVTKTRQAGWFSQKRTAASIAASLNDTDKLDEIRAEVAAAPYKTGGKESLLMQIDIQKARIQLDQDTTAIELWASLRSGKPLDPERLEELRLNGLLPKETDEAITKLQGKMTEAETDLDEGNARDIQDRLRGQYLVPGKKVATVAPGQKVPDSKRPHMDDETFGEFLEEINQIPNPFTQAELLQELFVSSSYSTQEGDTFFSKLFGGDEELEEYHYPAFGKVMRAMSLVIPRPSDTVKGVDMSGVTDIEDQLKKELAVLDEDEVTPAKITELSSKYATAMATNYISNVINPPSDTEGANAEALKWLKENPDHPDAPAIRAKLGM